MTSTAHGNTQSPEFVTVLIINVLTARNQDITAETRGVRPAHSSNHATRSAAVGLITDIQHANEQTFHRRKPFHPKNAPWWNPAYAIAAKNLCNARGTGMRGVAQKCFKGAVRAAKRQWADSLIERADFWDVAAWRHGCRISKVPFLRGVEGLVYSHDEVADILSHRFFAKAPPQVVTHFHDDPPVHPTHQLSQIDKEPIDPLIKKAAAKSAPGQTGHTWTVVKWAWEADADHITELLTACLRAGHHWHTRSPARIKDKRPKKPQSQHGAEWWHQAPRSSLAYKTVLTKPPDGRPHPTFLVRQDTVKFSRLTLCTLYRVITGHAFVGSYTQRFFPQHTPEQVACP
jgi:hypothetical protein